MKGLEAAGYRMTPVRAAGLRLDGGAMFGVVPKALWKERTGADERNRISLAADPLLLRGRRKTILLEGGTSTLFDAKRKDIYGVSGPSLVSALEAMGVGRGDVNLVIMSHLHFDHAGGLVTEGPKGLPEPSFPKARIIVQEGELADALAPPEIRRASYRTEDLELLAAAGLFSPVEGPCEVEEGIFVEPRRSHTRRHQVIRVGSGPGAVVFVGDLIPTAAHVNPAWLMAYDLYPLDCAAARKDFLERAAAREWILYFYHDPKIKAGRVARNEKGAYVFSPLL